MEAASCFCSRSALARRSACGTSKGASCAVRGSKPVEKGMPEARPTVRARPGILEGRIPGFALASLTTIWPEEQKPLSSSAPLPETPPPRLLQSAV